MMNVNEPDAKRTAKRTARPIRPGQRLVGVGTFAEMIGISPAGAYRILHRQEIPVVRLGGRTLIAVTEIDKFIEARSGAFLDRRA
jgi:hypothetical protein